MLWRDIIGYGGFYQVSNTGLVRGLDRYNRLGRFVKGVIKTQIIQNSGYSIVNLKVNGKQKNHLVHRLVALAFISNETDDRHFINHIDGNKQNNHVSNLEWVTKSENMKHAYNLGLANTVNHRLVKVTDNDGVNIIFKSQFEVSKYFGFTNGWCHQRVLRNGNTFKFKGFTVEVL